MTDGWLHVKVNVSNGVVIECNVKTLSESATLTELEWRTLCAVFGIPLHQKEVARPFNRVTLPYRHRKAW